MLEETRAVYHFLNTFRTKKSTVTLPKVSIKDVKSCASVQYLLYCLSCLKEYPEAVPF